MAAPRYTKGEEARRDVKTDSVAEFITFDTRVTVLGAMKKSDPGLAGPPGKI
jgi:hypothetical protein